MQFVWADAWVLLSIINAKKPVDRKGIVATGDYLNHAIMNPEELEGGLRRLTVAGYVKEEQAGFVLGLSGEEVATDIAEAGVGSETWALPEEFTVVEKALGVAKRWT